MKKLRLLAWIITLTMLCELLPLGTFAQSDIGQSLAQAVAQNLEEENSEAVAAGKCGDNLTWSLSDDGTLTISGTGDMYNYNDVAPYNISPWYHDLTSSNSGGYSGVSIKNVTIREGVTSIGNNAFLGCGKISNIEFPDSLTSIGKSAFSPSPALNEVTLPKNLVNLGAYAFSSGNFSSIEIPEGVTSIQQYTFSGCKKLASIQLPKSLISIEDGAFNGCAELLSIQIPNTVSSLGKFTFFNCISLFSPIQIPNGVTCIPKGLLDGCSSFSSISIPKSVTSIEDSAFYGCASLTDVYFEGTQSQWDAISVSKYQNDALLNATIHYQATDSKDEHIFTKEKDNLNFLNSASYFFTQYELTHSSSNPFHSLVELLSPRKPNSRFHHLSSDKFDQLTKYLAPRVKQHIKSIQLSSWDGSCEGMSRVVLLHYIAPDRIPLQEVQSSASTVYNLDSPRDNVAVEDLINYYYLMQRLPTAAHYSADVVERYYDNVQDEIASIIDELKANRPVLAGITCDEGGHAIVLLRILNETDDFCTIDVYDPNIEYGSDDSKHCTLTLYKNSSYVQDGSGAIFPKISYTSAGHSFYCINGHILARDIEFIDLRNFFGLSDYETKTDYDRAYVTLSSNSSMQLHSGHIFIRAENGKLIEASTGVQIYNPFSITDSHHSSSAVLSFSKPSISDAFELQISSKNGSSSELLLNDTLLSISTSGPVSLAYNEEARTVDVTAETPTDVNVLMTQNETTTDWPWHSWAIDTTGTTEFHAELKDDGLHLSGDGIANAQYATENADTDIVDSGAIPAKANEVTIIKKDGNNQKTEIKDNTQTKPTDPDKLTVTVVDGKITAIDDVPIADDTTVLDNVTEGAKITITANDKSADGKTFREWVVTPEHSVTLSDASSSTASFTMGAVSVTIKAQYDPTTPTPIPTPGGGDSGSGGSSSGGGGGDGGGAAVILGLGAAAAVTAGVILTMPVDVQGRVELADHAVVPGAKVSLLKNGNVVTQTTADESGHFSLKAKRGDYELTVVYTDANGQFVQKTSRIKAPAKDFVVIF